MFFSKNVLKFHESELSQINGFYAKSVSLGKVTQSLSFNRSKVENN